MGLHARLHSQRMTSHRTTTLWTQVTQLLPLSRTALLHDCVLWSLIFVLAQTLGKVFSLESARGAWANGHSDHSKEPSRLTEPAPEHT
eukprot:3979981-Amphidinium_carterae.1